VKRRFVVQVSDLSSRYQPFSLTADLPLRGLYAWDCAGPASPLTSPLVAGPPAVPLFSAPSREAPAGMATIRATLWDASAAAPAAWAVLEVSTPGQAPARGIADSQGRVVVLFPYPEPTGPSPVLSSPLVRSGVPLAQQQWTVAVRAAYAPRPETSAPDLCGTLRQASAFLWADSDQSVPLTEATLLFGQELVLRTTNASHGTPLSLLYVTAATSPP
jgi:hypothetical protein